ncbi:conserved protein of unknown function [Candidatus Nitrosocosmicus franklandus]|uniref:Uncharacterized protein n=1 Tax=Candidatus Nitrosocosmicus franklandianus TaxID=1798806 RepID=A0A484IBH8_9ARCH|nr:conserved protein of unknown function [Candidatus Nitrosocosmicus franklandus]
MKKITLIILSTFVSGVMLLNIEIINFNIYGQGNIDRSIIPLLTPPYQIVSEFKTTDMNKFNVSFVNNMP